MKSLIIFGSLVLISSVIIAQPCQKNLTEANRAYYNGQLRQVIQLLEPCIEANQLNKKDKAGALKLLVNTKLLQNQEHEADLYLKEYLTINPTYELREDELAEFKNLFRTYDIRTKYSYGFTVGTLHPDYIIMRHQSYSGQTKEPSDFDAITGLSLGFTGDYSLLKNLYINASLLAAQRSFKQQEEIMEYQKVASHETDYYLDVPIQLKYVLDLGKLKPFVAGGYALHYLIHSKGNIDHVPLAPDIPMIIGVPEQIDNYNLTDLRRRFTHNWVVSAGVMVDFKHTLLEIRASYEIGVNNQIKTDRRHQDRDLVETFAYIPDDYRVNSLTISVVFSRNILKPFKLK